MRLLSIEDDATTSRYLRKGLTEHGHVVDLAHDGRQGMQLAHSGRYDLILLDVSLPDTDGWQLLEDLRAHQRAPVFMLTGHDSVDDRVRGLNLGADDYLVKPFAFAELLARIQAAARRNQPAPVDKVLRVADLEVDQARRLVRRDGRRLALTTREFTLLEYLARHAGQALSRTLIAESCWDMHFDSDTNVIDVAVRRLRAKVDDPFQDKLIHTIRGVGYVLDHRPG